MSYQLRQKREGKKVAKTNGLKGTKVHEILKTCEIMCCSGNRIACKRGAKKVSFFYLYQYSFNIKCNLNVKYRKFVRRNISTYYILTNISTAKTEHYVEAGLKSFSTFSPIRAKDFLAQKELIIEARLCSGACFRKGNSTIFAMKTKFSCN